MAHVFSLNPDAQFSGNYEDAEGIIGATVDKLENHRREKK